MLTGENKIWLEEALEKVEKKLSNTTRQIGDTIPFTTTNGVFDDKFTADSSNCNGMYWWTNGFYPGILWLMYLETKDEFYKTTAESIENKLDKALLGFEGLHHDVGFMWETSAVADYKITGNNQSKNRGMLAASILASRFNMKGNYIRAWNDNCIGWAIIDCMLNIPILYWATEQSGDDRFAAIARTHADKAAKHFVREDGSVKHIVVFDENTGEEKESLVGQGYAVGSSWSRGQGWGLYGFILSYIHTKDEKYLNTAKKIAHYFISCIQEDFIPNCDFRTPKSPVVKDSSAGAIAACGLIEISKYVGEHEKALYLDSAVNILKALTEKCADFSEECQELLKMGTGAYHEEHSRHMALIYGDYYYFEALLKLKGNEVLFWG
jgi:unsaturated chondroitin disaccharide hydrolase